MTLQTAILKLSSPVKDLVLSATHDGSEYIGQSDNDQAEVISWIEKSSQAQFVAEGNLQNLNTVLVPRTYVATNYLTAADFAVYGSLHPVISKLQASQYHALPALTRYFDHVQSSPPVLESVKILDLELSLVSFDLENAPKQDRTNPPPKKQAKAVEPSPAADKSAPSSATHAQANPAPSIDQAQKKEKKEKKKDNAGPANEKKAGGAKAAPAEDAGEPVPSMIDLRVGHIVDVIKHPDADGLYVEQIDIGEETGLRTVVSGLVNYIPIENMRDQYLVAVCNLKPVSMRGIKSFAMVLCATSKDGKEGGIELIKPPANSKPGDRVYFEGAEFETATPLSQLNPKKKIFETIQPGFITLDTKEAAWVNPTTKSVHRIRTKDGVCIAPTLIGASLS